MPFNRADPSWVYRVTNYIRCIHYGVGMITRSCRVNEPHQLRREHVLTITENGLSIALDKGYLLGDQPGRARLTTIERNPRYGGANTIVLKYLAGG